MDVSIVPVRSAELGNTSYLLVSDREKMAVVIDPVRDIGQYLDIVASAELELTWSLETHVHNDFVSGSREFASTVGSKIGASSDAGLRYHYEHLSDGDEIGLGSWRLRVLATPGHTPEHVAYLLLNAMGQPEALFSGGALMVGTAARTDLFGPALSWRFAHDLERSLKEKILQLPDEVVVYPTHGGGSFCAVGAGDATMTTIGAERVTNPLATARSSRQFVTRSLIAGTYPTYYARMRNLNQIGAPLLGLSLIHPPELDLASLDHWLAQGALLLDIRTAQDFRSSHIPGSIATGADGNISGWVGWLVGPEKPLVLVADAGSRGAGEIQEAVSQLVRIGYDRIVGYLGGGLDAWQAAGRKIVGYDTLSAAMLAERLDADELLPVVDVREAAEWHAGHIPGSVSLPLHDILTQESGLVKGIQVAVHCGHDYRATLGASLLEQVGYSQLSVVIDGWEGWSALEEVPR